MASNGQHFLEKPRELRPSSALPRPKHQGNCALHTHFSAKQQMTTRIITPAEKHIGTQTPNKEQQAQKRTQTMGPWAVLLNVETDRSN